MDVTCLWQMPAVSDGTHRTLCFRQRSQAKAFPILPSLASMATTGLEGGEASPAAGWWGSPIMPRRVRFVNDDALGAHPDGQDALASRSTCPARRWTSAYRRQKAEARDGVSNRWPVSEVGPIMIRKAILRK